MRNGGVEAVPQIQVVIRQAGGGEGDPYGDETRRRRREAGVG